MTTKARDTLTSVRWNATDVNALDITKMNAIPGSKRRKEINPILWREEKKKYYLCHSML